jgi:cbb3-type cytochrome oxidase cytochrome c subunit
MKKRKKSRSREIVALIAYLQRLGRDISVLKNKLKLRLCYDL